MPTFLNAPFDATKFLWTQFRERSLHLPGMLSKSSGDEVVATRGDKEGQALAAELQGLGAEVLFVHSDVREVNEMRNLVSNHVTDCPYKGGCIYYSASARAEKSVNAVWSYEHAFPAVSRRRDMLRSIPSE